MKKKWTKTVLIHGTLVIACFIIAAPLLFALVGSTHTRGEASSYPPKISFGSAGFENYETARKSGLGKMMWNTFFVALSATLLKTVIALFAALALVYFQFRFKNLIFFFILITLMFPIPVRVVALYDLVQKLKMGNTYLALILPFIASATGTFLFRQHFMSIPSSFVDAARIDGAGPIKFLIKILIPMSLNAIGALALILFIYMWNEYLWPLIVITSKDKQLVQLGLKMLMQDVAGEQVWGVAMAGAVITILPPLFLFILLQRQFTRGFALTSGK